jgi:dipeptidyl aminopeptidase/acylaminoacyl peptidase
MKKKWYLLFPIMVLATIIVAQKPMINTSVFGKWPSVVGAKISNDGRFFLYSIRNQPVNSSTLIVQSLQSNWKINLTSLSDAFFSLDSKTLIYQSKDTLCLLQLGTSETKCIRHVISFELFKNEQSEYLLYKLDDSNNKFIIRNTSTNYEQDFSGFSDLLMSANGKSLLLKKSTAGNKQLYLSNLNNKVFREPKLIWTGSDATNFVMNNSGTQLAFMGSLQNKTSVYYYETKMNTARNIVGQFEIDQLVISDIKSFNSTGNRLFIQLKENIFPALNTNSINIWSYVDAKAQSQQLKQDVQVSQNYLAMLDVKQQKITRLQYANEQVYPISNEKNDNWILISKAAGDAVEQHWNRLSQPVYFLLNTANNSRVKVNVPFRILSPNGRYLLGTDDTGNIYSFETATASIKNITSGFSINIPDSRLDQYVQDHSALSVSTKWLAEDAGVFVYDKHDIWLVDPQGKNIPACITGNYGSKHHTSLRFMEGSANDIIDPASNILLTAFNHQNKNDGFFETSLKSETLRLLSMGAYIFTGGDYFYLGGETPVKALNKEVYVIRRSNAKESPNYFLTTNFTSFKALSHIYPEKEYNWLSSELIEFTMLDNTIARGILYKPENFDARKKYPVIFTYYENNSQRLHQYYKPDYSDGNINVPYFVSQGYLVFIPDINSAIGKIGESAYNAIVGAARHLAKYTCIDASKMGLSGHSFGGYETNYIISHSNLFKAACSDAGIADFISMYGKYQLEDGFLLQRFVEKQQPRMGSDLWSAREVYINNSPIFHADQVKTPVLIISNQLDPIAHVEQGIEFFTALRKLNKPAWMLQYEGEQHSVSKKENRLDLTIKMKQFFDHYLKNSTILIKISNCSTFVP